MNELLTVAGFCLIAAVMSAALLSLVLLRAGQGGRVARLMFLAGFLAVLLAVPTAAGMAVIGGAPGSGFGAAFAAAFAVTLAVLAANLVLSRVLGRRAAAPEGRARALRLSPAALGGGLVTCAALAAVCAGLAVLLTV